MIFGKILNYVFLVDGESNSGCFENNIDFKFNDVPKGTVRGITSAEDCEKQCRRKIRCKFFTYHKLFQVCWLKTSDSGRRKAGGHISGRMNCPQSSNLRGEF